MRDLQNHMQNTMVVLRHCFRVVYYAVIDLGTAFFFILVSPEPTADLLKVACYV